MTKRLFVDMDGTLAVFKKVDTMEILYEKGYFLNLVPLHNVVDAIRLIIDDNEVEVNILSAYLTDSAYALEEKHKWLDKHLPELPVSNRLFIPCGMDKKEIINGKLGTTDYLLDDYTHNLTLWQPPARGIKLLNGINHTNESWEYDCIRFDKNSEQLKKDILSIMSGNQIIDKKPIMASRRTIK